jgi:hypothetical protein
MGKKEKSECKKVFFNFQKKEEKMSNGRGFSNKNRVQRCRE